MTDSWIAQRSNPRTAPKEVGKAWIKDDPPKMNQEMESGVASVENHADIDYKSVTRTEALSRLLLEWMQIKRSLFGLPSWHLAPDLLCGKELAFRPA